MLETGVAEMMGVVSIADHVAYQNHQRDAGCLVSMMHGNSDNEERRAQ